MAMNRVQFQRGLSMAEFLEHYGSEEKCHAALVAARWPQGFRCPLRCPGTAPSSVKVGSTGSAARPTPDHRDGGTMFEATKLPLSRWFLAMHLLTQAKNNVSAWS